MLDTTISSKLNFMQHKVNLNIGNMVTMGKILIEKLQYVV